jgi:hypothetical protein
MNYRAPRHVQVALVLWLAFFVCSYAFGQTPNLSGVWQADLKQSKVAGLPIKSYVAIIGQAKAVFDRRTKEEALQVTDLTGVGLPFGEERETLKFFVNGKPAMSPFEGVPARLTGTASGNTVTVQAEIAGTGDRFTRVYTLSPDSHKLTLHIAGTQNGHSFDNLYVLMKQPDSAGAALRQPEQTAGEHFKNVKTDAMKSLPTSEFIDDMRYFAWALGKDCQFCHVEHRFDSDEKKEKQTARKMIDMTASIDQTNFKGHPAVRCFTCHNSNARPRAYPPFPDETAQSRPEAESPHPPASGN